MCKMVHSGVKYPCHACDFSTASLANLKTHVRWKHEGVRFGFFGIIKDPLQPEAEVFHIILMLNLSLNFNILDKGKGMMT